MLHIVESTCPNHLKNLNPTSLSTIKTSEVSALSEIFYIAQFQSPLNSNITIFTESWLNRDTHTRELGLFDFSVYLNHNDLTSKFERDGGVHIASRKTLLDTLHSTSFSHIEQIFIKVIFHSNSPIILPLINYLFIGFYFLRPI
jgi:hypothetical protein